MRIYCLNQAKVAKACPKFNFLLWRNWYTCPPVDYALVAELVYALRLGRSPVRVRGSSPLEGTTKFIQKITAKTVIFTQEKIFSQLLTEIFKKIRLKGS